MKMIKSVVVRGGGDLATGVVQKLVRAGLPVLVLEQRRPMAIRRSVALSEAIYDESCTVEDLTAKRINAPGERFDCWRRGEIPVLIDPDAACVSEIRPDIVIDAIIAKRNLGTHRSMAPVTIALGPGFAAGEDVNAVIETMRGHDLGRLILSGTATRNTGIPAEIAGKAESRVLHAPCTGVVRNIRSIGDIAQKGTPLLVIGQTTLVAPFDGLLRGLIREGIAVEKGAKIADIDPRLTVDWRTISDKARCLGGAVLEACFYLFNQKKEESAHDASGNGIC